jgi:hypothetical protein
MSKETKWEEAGRKSRIAQNSQRSKQQKSSKKINPLAQADDNV